MWKQLSDRKRPVHCIGREKRGRERGREREIEREKERERERERQRPEDLL